MPPVYSKLQGEGLRTTTAWQRSTHNGGDNFNTISDAEFPAWITNEGFLGAGRRPVLLGQFFHESCQPFQLAKHLHTRNVVYYLAIRDHDYSAAKAAEVCRCSSHGCIQDFCPGIALPCYSFASLPFLPFIPFPSSPFSAAARPS